MQEQVCETVNEQQCRTVQDTVNENVCETVQEQVEQFTRQEILILPSPPYSNVTQSTMRSVTAPSLHMEDPMVETEKMVLIKLILEEKEQEKTCHHLPCSISTSLLELVAIINSMETNILMEGEAAAFCWMERDMKSGTRLKVRGLEEVVVNTTVRIRVM